MLVDPVDDSICLENYLANVILTYFGDESPRTGERRDSINGIEDSTDPSRRRFRLVAGYEVTDVAQIPARTLCPLNRQAL